jgi:hypothetical protein
VTEILGLIAAYRNKKQLLVNEESLCSSNVAILALYPDLIHEMLKKGLGPV